MESDYSLESKFMSDFWQFRKAFRDPVDKEEFWENLVNESEKLHQKYNNRYLDQLILVCVDDIDERSSANKMIPEHTKEQLLKKLMNRLLKESNHDN